MRLDAVNGYCDDLSTESGSNCDKNHHTQVCGPIDTNNDVTEI